MATRAQAIAPELVRDLAFGENEAKVKAIAGVVASGDARAALTGELRAIVATNSLEMGIDIGSLDEVVLIQSPPAIASALQRIGRAGQGQGRP